MTSHTVGVWVQPLFVFMVFIGAFLLVNLVTAVLLMRFEKTKTSLTKQRIEKHELAVKLIQQKQKGEENEKRKDEESKNLEANGGKTVIDMNNLVSRQNEVKELSIENLARHDSLTKEKKKTDCLVALSVTSGQP